MNKMSEILKRFGLLLVVFILMFGTNIYAKSNNDNADVTMGEAKQILEDFLQKNHPEIRFGTDEYVEYLVEQLSEGTDSILKADPKADLMLDYASIYLYETEERQTATYGLFDNADYETLYNKTIGEMVREIKEDEENIQAIPIPLATIGPMPSYNKVNATAYARQWANSFNPSYNKYSSDCTNFVSQILQAGSLVGVIPQHNLPSGMTSDTSYWYYINSKQLSTSFIRVKDFYKFYASRVSNVDTASKSTAIKKVKKGDVVLLKKVSTGARYHAIFISKKSKAKGKAYYCAHTNARKDYDFDTIDDNANDYTILKFHLYDNN